MNILSYVEKDDTISWPYGLAILVIFLFWAIVSVCWYKFSLSLERKIASSDEYEQIRRNCFDYQNALRAFFQPSYNKAITSTRDGLIFRDIRGEKLYSWDKIKNIILGSSKSDIVISVIDEKDNKAEGKMPSEKKIKPKAKIEAIEKVDSEIIGTVLNHFNKHDNIRLLVLPDHFTPIECRTHTEEPVGFVMYGKGISHNGANVFNEKTSQEKGLAFENGEDMIEYFMRKYL